MLKKLKQAITTVIAATALLVPMAVPVMVHAQADISNNLCSGVELNATAAACNPADGTTEANRLIKNIINVFSLVVGVVAVVMIIVGGFRYITSGGNDSSVSGAKNTILYAIVGLVIVALAQIIVRFVLTRATTTT